MATAKTYLKDGVRYDKKTKLPFAPTSQSDPSSAPISSATLTSEPDFKLTTPPPTTGATGLRGALETQSKQFTAELDQRRQEAERAKNDSLSGLLTALDSEQGPTALTAKLYSSKGGVDDIETELKDINSQMLQEQESLRRQIERLQTAPGSATAGERDRAVRETERVSLRKQADLAIIQLSKQGRYDSAKTIADRAIAVQLEEQTRDIKVRQTIYEDNKSLFTTAEARAFESKQGELNRQLQNEEYRLRAEYDQKLKQNDPAYQLGLQLSRLQIAKAQKELSPVATTDNPLVNPATGKIDLTANLANFIKQTGAKDNTNLQNIGGVLAAVQSLATANSDKQFDGTGPLAQFNPFKSAEGTDNSGSLGAINLKVQQWASGANLTEEQTKQVNQLVPRPGDFDDAIAKKTNALANFMLDQAKGTLAAQGQDYAPGKVDFFDTTAATDDFFNDVDSVLNSSSTVYQSAGYSL